MYLSSMWGFDCRLCFLQAQTVTLVGNSLTDDCADVELVC